MQRYYRARRAGSLLLLLFALTGLGCQGVQAAPASTATLPLSGFSIKRVGAVSIDSSSSIVTPTGLIYPNAHMRTTSGATLDADEIRANLKSGKPTGYQATGHVVAHADDIASAQSYDVTADKAVYDPATNVIDLTGKVVKLVAHTAYTEGPLVQTGDHAVVVLGPSQEYPDVTEFPTVISYNVHTEFTPKQ